MLPQVMNLLCHRRGIGIIVLIKAHGIPAILSPPLPVLDDGAHGNTLVVKPPGGGEKFFLRRIALPAVDVLEYPVRHLRDMTRQRTVSLHHLIRTSGEDRVIQSTSDR